jgi:ABC-type nitrate/sulfonate/bicarbonate transport system permease component
VTAPDLTHRAASANSRAADDAQGRLTRFSGALASPPVGWAALVLGIAVLWALVVQLGNVPAIIIPSPWSVAVDLIDSRQTYATALMETAGTAFLGLLLGTTAALLLAIASWWSKITDGVSRPMVYFLQAVPMTALIPVVSGLLGYGYPAAITLTTLSTLFPTYVIVGTALANPPASAGLVFRALGSSRGSYLRHVAIPSAVPALFTALQLSATLSILGAFATQYLQGSSGLGGLFALVRRDFSNPAMPWGIALLATVLSSVTYGVFALLSRRIDKRFS